MGLLWTIDALHRWAESPHPKVRLWAADRAAEFAAEQAVAIMARLIDDRDEDVAGRAVAYFIARPDSRVADRLLARFEGTARRLWVPCALALAGVGDARFVPTFITRCNDGSLKAPESFEILLALAPSRHPEVVQLLHAFLNGAEGAADDVARESAEAEEVPSSDDDPEVAVPGVSRLVGLCAQALLMGGESEDIALLIRYAAERPRHEIWAFPILGAIIDRSGGLYSGADLMAATRKPTRLDQTDLARYEFARLEAGGTPALTVTARRLLRAQNESDLIRELRQQADALVREIASQTPPAAFHTWEEGHSQTAVTFRLLRALASELASIERATPRVRGAFALSALAIFTRLAECRVLIGAAVERIPSDTQLAFLLAEREDVPEDHALITCLAANGQRADVVTACLAALARPNSAAVPRAAALLGRLQAGEAIAPLLALLESEEHNDAVYSAVEDALADIGEPVVAALEPVVRAGRNDQVLTVMDVLSRLPYERTADLVVTHFDQLRQVDAEALLGVVETLGDARFILRLELHAKEDEPEEAVWAMLCRLHQIDAPRLPAIEQRIADREHETTRRLEQAAAGDERALVQDTIALALQCQACRQVFTYRVREVYVDHSDRQLDTVYIRDPIACKQCGARETYTLTSQAKLAVTASLLMILGLAEAGKADAREGPVRLAAVRVAGRPMGPEEGLAHYRDEIERRPDRAELRVGYGNLLRFLKRDEEAADQFQAAVERDPFAVEALSALAQMAADAGDLRNAYELYGQCLDRFARGRFYRTSDDQRDALREHAEIARWDLAESLGLRPEPPQDALFTPAVRTQQAGRNDPCPCGSGKKYKKCCLDKAAAATRSQPETTVTPDEIAVMARVATFAGQARFRDVYIKALLRFFPEASPDGPDLKPGDPELGQFLDWFIHDYPLTDGRTLIEEFSRTEGYALPRTEQDIVREAIGTTLSVFEVQDSRPERAEIDLQDLFTGETFLVHDAAGSRQVVKWDLIVTRLTRIGGRLRSAPIITRFPPDEREDLVEALTAHRQRYQTETGEVSWRAFLKARGDELFRYSRAREHDDGPKPVLTPEYHPLAACEAVYAISHPDVVRFRLTQAPDFRQEEAPLVGAVREPPLHRFAWLKRGPSRAIVPDGARATRGLVFQNSFAPTPISEGVVALGDVKVTEQRLTLETLSRERLAAGKQRLADVLGGMIRFETDRVEPIKAPARPDPTSRREPEPCPTTSHGDLALGHAINRHFERWMDTPIPALDGRSPRAAVTLPGGQMRVERLLRSLENNEERKKRQGQGWIDVPRLRERLGLTGSAGSRRPDA